MDVHNLRRELVRLTEIAEFSGGSTVVPGAFVSPTGGTAAERQLNANLRAGALHWRAFCRHTHAAVEAFGRRDYAAAEEMLAAARGFYTAALELRLTPADAATLVAGVKPKGAKPGRRKGTAERDRKIAAAVAAAAAEGSGGTRP